MFRGPGKLDWIFGSSLDPVVRPLDLSDLRTQSQRARPTRGAGARARRSIRGTSDESA